MIKLNKIFACPKCKREILASEISAKCQNCKLSFKKRSGIWDFLYLPNRITSKSLKSYDSMHKIDFGGPIDGSYEILSSIARGNKTVDIACGEGLIERLSPDIVGVEFSINALNKARAKGIKNLVLADAHYLPFRENSFDVAISSGNLEHFADPKLAIDEMARISKIQVLIVHREFDLPFIRTLRKIMTNLLNIKHQPIERPLKWSEIETILKKANLDIVFKGFWTLPVNYGRVIKLLPVFNNIPSCFFVISIKK